MISLYNTLSRKVEPLSPAGDVVRMYVCGVTPYAASHVGHAMRAVVFDVLRRYLEFRGYEVRHVENFTDIDDKMIAGAAQQAVTTQELAERNIEAYLREMDALKVLRAHVYPRATQEIPRILEMIKALQDRGFAYQSDGSVYFRVRSDADYGKLSRRSLDGMRAGARVEVDERKEDTMDFAPVEEPEAGRAGVGQPLGSRETGMAHRVQCNGPDVPGRDGRHPRRGPGAHLPAPRERDCPVRVVHRPRAFRAVPGCTTGWSGSGTTR